MHANKRTGYDKTVRNPRPRTLKRKNQASRTLSGHHDRSCNWTRAMPGPQPFFRPDFPPDFLAQAQAVVRRRTVRFQLRQRASLVLLLHQHPLLSNPAAAIRVQLHPNSVRLWRKRWAEGDFTLEDRPGRGRKPDFSPAGRGHRQSDRLRDGRRDEIAPVSPVVGRPDQRAITPWRSRSAEVPSGGSWMATRSSLGGTSIGSSPRSAVRREGGSDPGPLGGAVARPASWPQGPYHQRRREDEHPGPDPLSPQPGPRSRRPRRVEHEYGRGGALQYLAAWDVRRGYVMGVASPRRASCRSVGWWRK